jgi:hypothetical protein
MIQKDLAKIAEPDLQSLIDNSVIERKSLDYKKTLPGNSDSDKKEFLADISSFANASGGDLIFGISQDNATGLPKELEGLEIENVDREIQRLSNIIRDGIEPRIPSVDMQPLSLSNSKMALIIRVQKSWLSPHRIAFRGDHRFYIRNSNGKHELDVDELRVVFTYSQTVAEKIRVFREKRISNIYANETPVPFYENAKITLHLIPIISFNPGQNYDIEKVASKPEKFRPIYCNSWNYRYNLDGFLSYSASTSGKSHSYIQLFRNGIIEIVEGLLLKPDNGKLWIPSIAYEREIIGALNESLDTLKSLDIELPIFVFLTLIGVRGYKMMYLKYQLVESESAPIDRDILLLPEVLIESYDVKSERILKPIFDSVWNACGFPKSLNYDKNGEWAPPRR